MGIKELITLEIVTSDKFVELALADKGWVALVSDILGNDKFVGLQYCKHHRGMSRLDHCIHVSYSSYLFCRRHKLSCTRIAVRGGLLHDFFLYDYCSEIGIKRHWLHGLFHPKVAVENAIEEFDLSGYERNVILRHMFPLTPIPPVTQGGWVVTLYDKIWAVRELSRKRVYVQ